uniref:Uncharacterized protein n=1 Tax=Acrobeloides nanus TaxID=290746 RepID=A0A914CYB7_9BILA
MALHPQVSEVGDVSHRMVNDMITSATDAILNQEDLSSDDKKTMSDLQSHEFTAKTLASPEVVSEAENYVGKILNIAKNLQGKMESSGGRTDFKEAIIS